MQSAFDRNTFVCLLACNLLGTAAVTSRLITNEDDPTESDSSNSLHWRSRRLDDNDGHVDHSAGLSNVSNLLWIDISWVFLNNPPCIHMKVGCLYRFHHEYRGEYVESNALLAEDLEEHFGCCLGLDMQATSSIVLAETMARALASRKNTFSYKGQTAAYQLDLYYDDLNVNGTLPLKAATVAPIEPVVLGLLLRNVPKGIDADQKPSKDEQEAVLDRLQTWEKAWNEKHQSMMTSTENDNAQKFDHIRNTCCSESARSPSQSVLQPNEHKGKAIARRAHGYTKVGLRKKQTKLKFTVTK